MMKRFLLPLLILISFAASAQPVSGGTWVNSRYRYLGVWLNGVKMPAYASTAQYPSWLPAKSGDFMIDTVGIDSGAYMYYLDTWHKVPRYNETVKYSDTASMLSGYSRTGTVASSQWLPNANGIYYSAGNVGINVTPTTTEKLSVAGDIRLTGVGQSYRTGNNGYISESFGTRELIIGNGVTANTSGTSNVKYVNANGSFIRLQNNAVYFYLPQGKTPGATGAPSGADQILGLTTSGAFVSGGLTLGSTAGTSWISSNSYVNILHDTTLSMASGGAEKTTYFVDATSQNIVVTLPAGALRQGTYVDFKRIDSSAFTARLYPQTSGTPDVIDGFVQTIPLPRKGSIRLQSTATGWAVIGKYDPVGGGGGATSPAGSDTYVQTNVAGAFGASANFRFYPTDKQLQVGAEAPTASIFKLYVGETGQAGRVKFVGNDAYGIALRNGSSDAYVGIDVGGRVQISDIGGTPSALIGPGYNEFVNPAYFGGSVIPTKARIEIAAGTATAGTAPFNVAAGTLNTTPIVGAWEVDANGRLWVTLVNGARALVQMTQISTGSASTLTLGFQVSEQVHNGTGSTWTLPTPVGSTNFVYYLKNIGSGTVVINAASGNQIYTSSAVSTFNMLAGESYRLVSNGTYWLVE